MPAPLALFDAVDLVQKRLGHAQLTFMGIYIDAVGAEEQGIARRMWM